MFNRLLNLFGVGVLYFAASMFIAQTLLFAYLAFAWKIDRDRLSQIVATAQGYDLYKLAEETRREQIDAIQQLTYDEVLRERANRLLQGDMDQARSGLLEDAVLAQIRQFEDRKKQFDEIVRNFEKRLADLEKERKSAGFNELVTDMSLLDAALAKKHIMEMLKNKQEDRVVEIFNALEERPRKKLLNAMREEEDTEKLADILRRIGDGEPESRLAQEARDELLK